MASLMIWKRLLIGNGWPKLRAKGAATRHLSAYALDLATRFCADNIRIIAVIQLLTEFYTILENEGLYLSTEAISRIQEIGREFCTIDTQLSNIAFRENVKLWKQSPSSTCFYIFASGSSPIRG